VFCKVEVETSDVIYVNCSLHSCRHILEFISMREFVRRPNHYG
jgi:hypothetical protein